MTCAIGIDIGGTFIDIVLAQRGGVRYVKVPSTPDAPARGVLQGLADLCLDGSVVSSDVARVIHGSTVATNALLEGSWGRTALVTTKGFRDVLEIGRQDRPRLYDLHFERPRAIVPRDLRFEISERIDSRGRELRPVSAAELTKVIERLRASDIEAVAVVFLFSFLNAEHERLVGDALREALSVPVVLSSDVLPEFREYERTSTTVVTAALRPVVGAYTSSLEEGAAKLGLPRRWQIMQSSGAVTSAATVEREPARVLLSGPAGGVEGARAVGEMVGITSLITMDMGGTSCDVALIRDGRIGWSTSGEIGGHPVALPMVDIHTIGAGGGSIGWVDRGGALRVGPQSAGADPGPACYARGGKRPTVTDAHLVLGHLDPARPIGGLSALDRGLAANAVAIVAGELGLGVEQAALGMIEVSDAAMERAIRVISVERGHDPRDFALVAFGGAGPLHAVGVARRLGMRHVIVPRTAGVLSAFGLLTAEAGHDLSRSLVRPLRLVSPSELSAVLAELSATGGRLLRDEGVREGDIRYRASVDLRYVGQSHELNVDLPSGCDAVSDDVLQQLAAAFHEEHASRFGHAAPDEELELITARVRAYTPATSPGVSARAAHGSAVEEAREAWFDASGPTRARFFSRDELDGGSEVIGPAVLVGSESTVVVPSGTRGRHDGFGNLLLEVG
jgi:N-methylhydantoinase A